jgi:6-phosphogluconolactonase
MLEAFKSSSSLTEAAAHAVAERLVEGLRTRSRASLVGTGGRSPGPLYDRLHDKRLDWSRVIVTLSDERCVPAESADSNARLLRDRLLTAERAKAHLLPLWSPEDATADDACRRVEPALRALAPFDAVLLGMGEDGHVASLIPGSPVLAAGMDPAGERWVLPVPAGSGSPPLARITLTLPALLQAQAIFLLIAGEAKRELIGRALAGDDLPVRALLVQDRVPVRVLWQPKHER